MATDVSKMYMCVSGSSHIWRSAGSHRFLWREDCKQPLQAHSHWSGQSGFDLTTIVAVPHPQFKNICLPSIVCAIRNTNTLPRYMYVEIRRQRIASQQQLWHRFCMSHWAMRQYATLRFRWAIHYWSMQAGKQLISITPSAILIIT